jgi:hypothetical protein
MVDDGGTEDYGILAAEFPSLSIRVERNEKNLGAIRNIFHTIFYPAGTEYVMSMHEDDLLHPDYLALAVAALGKAPEAAFAGSYAVFFDNATELAILERQPFVQVASQTLSAQDFVRFLLAGNPFMLASVVYRTSFVARATPPDLAGFSTACDRPFLVDMAKADGGAVVFSAPLFFSRRHGVKDMRGKDLDWQQILRLFLYYKQQLPTPLSDLDARLFGKSATNNLLLTYRSLFPNMRPSFWRFVREGQRQGLIRLRYINIRGMFGLLSVLLGSKASFYLMRVVSFIKARRVSRQYTASL